MCLRGAGSRERAGGPTTVKLIGEMKVKLPVEAFVDQHNRWPKTGRHILAHYDDDTIVVYQAYSPLIGGYAIEHGRFGDGFKYTRMSWIKPNFMWMMYRSGWGRSQGQECVLGIRLRRSFFDSLLEQAVPSSFVPELFRDPSDWNAAVQRSDVRLQWDPDHLPNGHKCERRAIQIGLRGGTLESYGKREIIEIIDFRQFVAEQRVHIGDGTSRQLLMPVERVYWPSSELARATIGLDEADRLSDASNEGQLNSPPQ